MRFACALSPFFLLLGSAALLACSGDPSPAPVDADDAGADTSTPWIDAGPPKRPDDASPGDAAVDGSDASDAASLDTGIDAAADAEDASVDAADAGGQDAASDADDAGSSHLRWRQTVRSSVSDLTMWGDSMLVQDDAVLTFAATRGALQVPALVTLDAHSVRASELKGLSTEGAPWDIARSASGALLGVVRVKGDAGITPAIASWDLSGALLSSAPLATRLTFQSAPFDAKGGIAVGLYGQPKENELVGFDATGAQTFRTLLPVGGMPLLARAADGTVAAVQCADYKSPAHVTGCAPDGKARWTRDLLPGGELYDITAVGDRVVVWHEGASGGMSVTTLAAADGAVLADLPLPFQAEKVAALPTGELYATVWDQATIIKLDAHGKELWRDTLPTRTRAWALGTDASGHVFVLSTGNDPATPNGTITVASSYGD